MNLHTAKHLMPITERGDFGQAQLGWFPARIYDFVRTHRAHLRRWK